jgi:hypothetical protein
MALKLYRVGRLTFQFEEGSQPVGAEPVEEKKAEAKNKAKRPTNKKAGANVKGSSNGVRD